MMTRNQKFDSNKDSEVSRENAMTHLYTGTNNLKHFLTHLEFFLTNKLKSSLPTHRFYTQAHDHTGRKKPRSGVKGESYGENSSSPFGRFSIGFQKFKDIDGPHLEKPSISRF